MKNNKIFLLALSLILTVTCISNSFARTKDTGKDGKSSEGVLRAATGVYDLQQNKVSNIEFYTTNYGIFGLNVRGNVGGGYWPRRGNNQYIFGGGIWFAAQKVPPGSVTGQKRKLCVISYNPNSGASWMVPGSINDGDEVQNNLRDKYRVYFSTDFRPNDGAARIASDGPNWPIWDTDQGAEIKVDRYFGRHEPDVAKRNNSTYPKGPAFISGEDIFAVFKDTDLQRYEGGEDIQRAKGYPMRLQFEQMFYTWGFGDYKDFMFMKYDIINFSKDTLTECYMAPAFDMDIATRNNNVQGAANDRTRFYFEDTTLNMAVQWTNPDRGEGGRDFGYIGFDFLESPAVDANGFIRKDKKVFTNEEQLGLHAFRNWIIQNDPVDDDGRYNFLAEDIKDGDTGPGDKRFLMSTGPFKLRPDDTARVVIGLVMAKTSKGRDADGTVEDMAELVRKDIFAQRVYDDNFRTPRPPDIANVATSGINNGIIVTWDSTSELSTDPLENGLAFMGYRLFRARRLDLDTFDTDDRPAVSRGPLAWKQIAQYQIPPPFLKADRPFSVEGSVIQAPQLDSIEIINRVGTHRINVNRIPSRSFPWGQYFLRLQNEGRLSELARIVRGQFIVDSLRVDSLRISTTTTAGNITTTTISPMPFGFTVANLPAVRAAIYDYWEKGLGRFEFTKFETERFTIDSLIVPFMTLATNNRTFVDFGDDNNNGTIEVTDKIETTERILNNVDYYYKLRAFDEGEYWVQNTPSKLNDGVEGINTVRAVALASRAGQNSKIEITNIDSDKMGGFYNFRVSTRDQERLNQLFANKTLRIVFDPFFFKVEAPRLSDKTGTQQNNGVYGAQIRVLDSTTVPSRQIFNTFEFLEPIDGQIDFYRSIFSENGAVYLGNDTIRAATNQDTTWIIQRSGSWDSRFPIQQTIGLGFDYTLQQWGGRYRQWDDGVRKVTGNFTDAIVRPLMTTSLPMIVNPDLAGNAPTGFATSYNIGPAEYHIQMVPGGTEDITMTYNRRSGAITKTFRVPFLIPQVRNALTWKRIDPETGDSITMSYPTLLDHATLPFDTTANNGFITRLENVPVANFNLTSYGWVNSPRDINESPAIRNNQLTGAISQGKYLLSGVATDGSGDRVDFVNVFNASGTITLFDFANKGAAAGTRILPLITPAPATDLAAGDIAVTKTFGGGLGFPYPGASITVKISEHSPVNKEYTSSMLDSVRVVPNPYLVTHQGERSQYDAKVYFTKLPQVCTIRIYTVNGDLVRTLEHNEATNTSNDRVGMDIWDLLSSNNQRVVSQVFIAQISTPSGAESVVKFSIILGGFRTVPQ
ncbi:MAG: hypothetical protein JNL36_09090 [Candidatus Kapabacteria bacterium]|nr:hypothetical protein [Candidatus Kapabacteria bacterium]